jgi:hypothetical protein
MTRRQMIERLQVLRAEEAAADPRWANLRSTPLPKPTPEPVDPSLTARRRLYGRHHI